MQILSSSPETENLSDLEFRPIEFTGTAREYWGIFITNLLLSIATLGIYSAWAKVRRKRYFLNSTLIDGTSLNYHATGMQLFKGRLAAFVLLVSLSVLSQYMLAASFVITVLIVLAVPWVLNRSMRFNARVTSWRNVRFNWSGTYWRTFAVTWPSILLAIVSLGLMIPHISRWIYQYYARRYSFGETEFEESMDLRPFVMAVLSVLVYVFVPGIAGIAIIYFLAGFPAVNIDVLSLSLAVLTPTILVSAYIWYRTMCRNIVLRSLELGDAVKFHSTLKPSRMVWIQLTNFLVSVLSLGLMIPWAQIRIYSYLCDNTVYAFARDADEFIDQEQDRMNSFGEEFAELEGLDFSL
ncbi:MAG: YjgN family protein [Acidiferrobacterales bacterium]|nr:YjgN family protein [Acidiferrobacterales bacterium]